MSRFDLWGLAVGVGGISGSPGLELMRGWKGEAEVAELSKGARVLGSWGQLRRGLELWSQ